MKKTLFLVLVSLAVLSCATINVFAQSLSATATVPSATGQQVTVSRVTLQGPTDKVGTWPTTPNTPGHTEPLDFGTLIYNTGVTTAGVTWSAFLPDHYFVIDVGVVYSGTATGVTNTTVGYTEATTGPSGTAMLGDRSSATFAFKSLNAAGVEQPDIVLSSGKRTLTSLATSPVTISRLTAQPAGVAGGWLRVYVGCLTGDPTASPAEPTGTGVTAGTSIGPFSPGDVSTAQGAVYRGTLVVTFS